ncbi:unnamed protein product [Clonostachys rosea f. rosea IK726]|uniref:Uncharacterized protein n=1 Tax=Clonostachys rosea f. rosea IK726 TaxID=1349383 RepID=A0ACA9UGL0_BIOOC|nr:unnamed protein product [Clonostachys rosea f. rosea IK726]
MDYTSSRIGSLFGVHVAVLGSIFVQVHYYRPSPGTATPSLPFAYALQGLQIGRVHDKHSGCVELQHHDVVWAAGLSATEEGWDGLTDLICFQGSVAGWLHRN